MITTVKIGYVEIKVTANSPKNQDVAVKQLLVTVSLPLREERSSCYILFFRLKVSLNTMQNLL